MFWKEVKGYEGLYKVNRDGEVYSLKSKKNLKKIKRKGYLGVNLYKNGKMVTYSIHRLVAIAFIPNPDGKPEVNHKDGDKHNNSISNLEWSTGSENMIHAHATGLQIPSEKQREHAKKQALKFNEDKKTPVIQYDKDMNFVAKYESVTEASKSIKGDRAYVSDISKCCRGKLKTCKGFIWRFGN